MTPEFERGSSRRWVRRPGSTLTIENPHANPFNFDVQILGYLAQ
jgi:hypothetical protein